MYSVETYRQHYSILDNADLYALLYALVSVYGMEEPSEITNRKKEALTTLIRDRIKESA